MVDLLGRYSNPDIVSRLSRILDGQGRDRASRRTVPSVRQDQTRLRPDQVDQAVARYLDGATLQQVAAELGVNRYTVANHLERRGIPRRRQPLQPEQLGLAADLYCEGLSFTAVAEQIGADRNTIRRALRAAGIPIRPRPGWTYP